MTNSLKQKIFDLAYLDMERVETALKENLSPNLDLVKDIASHILFAGGKRLRPLLMINSARACGYTGKNEARFSVLFEYLHAATLLHDDVVDQASIRRSRKAAHHKWNPAKVVLTGDFLLARALDIASDACNTELISVIARVTNAMSQGEIDQLEQIGKARLSEDRYLKIIEGKTAVLIQAACQSGALLANAQKDKEQALAAFGYHLGMAFQMADDLLDYNANAKELGKNPGADLREGKFTMPLIKSLENLQDTPYEKDKAFLLSMIGRDDFSQEQFERFVTIIERSGGIAYTLDIALKHVKKAKQYLSLFEPSDSVDFLGLIADYAIQRRV